MRREDITGLVLAGGRGSRMGGLDKGLQFDRGRPLVAWMLERLRPQVGAMLVNANRNLAAYRAFDVAVCTDEPPGFGGPLSGMLSGLAQCRTAYLATTPCDAPDFPVDLVARLSDALEAHGADIAMAAVATPEGLRLQPVFALMKRSVEPDLRAFVRDGGARVREWMARRAAVLVRFDDPAAFANMNALVDLRSPIADE